MCTDHTKLMRVLVLTPENKLPLVSAVLVLGQTCNIVFVLLKASWREVAVYASLLQTSEIKRMIANSCSKHVKFILEHYAHSLTSDGSPKASQIYSMF